MPCLHSTSVCQFLVRHESSTYCKRNGRSNRCRIKIRSHSLGLRRIRVGHSVDLLHAIYICSAFTRSANTHFKQQKWPWYNGTFLCILLDLRYHYVASSLLFIWKKRNSWGRIKNRLCNDMWHRLWFQFLARYHIQTAMASSCHWTVTSGWEQLFTVSLINLATYH